MNDTAHLTDVRFKNSMRGRIRNHISGQIMRMLLRFAGQVIHIDISPFVASNRYGGKSRLNSASRIGSVSRSGDQNDFTMPLFDTFEITADDDEPGKLSRGARIRLQADSGKTGDFGQHRFEFVDELQIPRRLFHGGIRMDALQRRKPQRQHARSRIKFHCTRTQRNHGMRQRNILALQTFDVTHQFRFGMIAVKGLVLQKIGLTNQLFAKRRLLRFGAFEQKRFRAAHRHRKYAQQLLHPLAVGRFIDADAYLARGEIAEVDRSRFGVVAYVLNGDFRRQFNL